LFNRETVTFRGSEDEYFKLFSRYCNLDADVYFATSEAERAAEARKRCKKQGNVYGEDVMHIPVVDQLPTLGKERYRNFMMVGNVRCGLSGCHTFDVEQNPSFCSSGWLMPALVTHGTIVSGKYDVILAAREHMLVQGEPAIAGVGGQFGCCFQELVDELASSTFGQGSLKRLAGNAMHLSVASSFFFIVSRMSS
jgi:hypothetical protein